MLGSPQPPCHLPPGAGPGCRRRRVSVGPGRAVAGTAPTQLPETAPDSRRTHCSERPIGRWPWPRPPLPHGSLRATGRSRAVWVECWLAATSSSGRAGPPQESLTGVHVGPTTSGNTRTGQRRLAVRTGVVAVAYGPGCSSQARASPALRRPAPRPGPVTGQGPAALSGEQLDPRSGRSWPTGPRGSARPGCRTAARRPSSSNWPRRPARRSTPTRCPPERRSARRRRPPRLKGDDARPQPARSSTSCPQLCRTPRRRRRPAPCSPGSPCGPTRAD